MSSRLDQLGITALKILEAVPLGTASTPYDI